LAKKAGITFQQVTHHLKQLEEDNLIHYKPVTTDSEMTLLVPREDDITINRFSKEIKLFINQKRKKTKELIKFIENNKLCRSIQILNYFDELSEKKCGICDVCLSEKKNKKIVAISSILLVLEDNKNLSSSEICNILEGNEEDILIHLRYLLSTNKIAINNQNKFYLN
jgi:ATP-dependent DNA helicase RecQ